MRLLAAEEGDTAGLAEAAAYFSYVGASPYLRRCEQLFRRPRPEEFSLPCSSSLGVRAEHEARGTAAEMWRNWYKLGFWSWWWQTQAGRTTKGLLLVAGGALGGLGGYAASAGSFSAAHAAGVVELTTIRSVEVRREPVTVDKLVTVRLHGHTIRKLVPIVRTVVGPTRTGGIIFRTVTAPAAFRPPTTVTGPPSTTLPGETFTVTVPTTRTETRVVDRPRIVTARQTVTNVQTVVAQHTVTQQADAPIVTRTATETQTQVVPQTTTVTRTTTQTQTQTVPVTTTVARTVTQTTPLVTVTQTTTVTQTVPVTTTVAQTTTVTRTTTVTATVTVPAK